ncbi:MAG: hypothetical protein QMD85_02995 [Candidatus Aenigmarchaeota archaeon]|nr:hypothetical protein [Candidatus Aenigmarchaeota archaeon]MDI6722506.1 hypothetical protein [Candidatus Aenigmarchaeota archaeon]
MTNKIKICPACEKGTLIEVDNIISEIDGYVFIENGQRCTECGEEFIHEKDARRTIEAAKKLGIWPQPLRLHRNLSKSGRGLVLRIPSDLEKDLRLKPGESVAISRVGSKIIIESED